MLKMKKFVSTLIIILAVSVAITLIGAILLGVGNAGSFNLAPLADAFRTLGIIGAALSGVVLAAVGVVTVVRTALNNEEKK